MGLDPGRGSAFPLRGPQYSMCSFAHFRWDRTQPYRKDPSLDCAAAHVRAYKPYAYDSFR